jgi:hypothetical protein
VTSFVANSYLKPGAAIVFFCLIGMTAIGFAPEIKDQFLPE